MTQEANNYSLPSGAEEVAICVERVIIETAEDLKNIRVGQTELRTDINAVVEENLYLNGKLGQLIMSSATNENMKERLLSANDMFAKAVDQINVLQKDRRSLQIMQECSQRTIKNLEKELKAYRAQLLANNEQELNDRLASQQEEIRKQSEKINTLREQKSRCDEQIKQLQAKLVEERQNDKVALMQKKLEDFDKTARKLLDESNKREEAAMCKIQDALIITEAAVSEKNEAEKRAAAYKEEAANLAINIGSIMDDAAKRVDDDVAQLMEKLAEKDKTIASLRDKLKTDAEQHKSTLKLLQAHNERLTQKCKETLQQNAEIEGHLEDCKMRIKEMEQSATNDEESGFKNKEYESRMVEYMHAYKKIRVQYKEIVDDLTKKFEHAFELQSKENGEMQAEIQILKNGAAGDGKGNLI